MKKNGFTLLELLAVIVILAIIAFISVPIILNVVEKSQKEAFRDSVYHIMKGVKLDAVVGNKTFPVSYVIEGNRVTPDVSFSGKINAYGEILVDKHGKEKVEVDNGKWCARKEYLDSKLVLSSSPCTDNPIIIGGLTVEIKEGEGLLISSSAISKGSQIIRYEFKIKKDNQIIDSYGSEENKHLFSFDKLSNHEQYQIEVEVKDDQNHVKSTYITYEFSYDPFIHAVSVTRNYNLLRIQADVTDPYHSSGAKQYRFALIKDNGNLAYENVSWSEVQSTNSIEYDLSSLEEGTYYIYVEATDNVSFTAYKTSEAYEFQKREVNSRYLIMEVYDHFASTGAAISELEFYDSSGKKLTYTIPNIYDSATNAVPSYWTRTGLWSQELLYDGKKTYASNTSTIFLYYSAGGSAKWTRAIIDFRSVRNLNDVKIWLGGPDGRTPKEVSFFISEEENINTIYNNNIKERSGQGLIKITDFTMPNDVGTVTMFERNNVKVYIFEKKIN